MSLRHAIRRLLQLCVLGLCTPAVGAPASKADELLLHVPSPDWRDQVIYFVLIDRFNDGDPRNNDQGADEFDPADPRRFSGGDLRGIRAQLDYIQGLGASTLWITPPVANQWWQPAASFSGYHGYWAEHFAEVDAHFGDLAEYQQLSDALHRRGMYLLQDIVVNHTANYFSCAEPAPVGKACLGYKSLPDSLGRSAPRQEPFDRNDPRKATHTRDPAYHWTPDVRDYTDPQQELNYQMSGLDDLDTQNPAVRRALRASYGHWIKEVGVDAFRVDTAFYVPADYFEDFLHAEDPLAPGIATVAAQTGRQTFLSFGEGFAMDAPLAETAGARIAAYAGPKRLSGMLNFPLYGSLLDVYARGAPTAVLAHRIESAQRLYPAPALWPSFIDNHDVDRYLATGDEAGLRLALLTIFTLPGIPVVYYGTEQGFRSPRAAMFAAGWGSEGRDHFDQDAPLYRYIAELSELRRAQRVLSRGTPTLLQSNSAAAGALAYVLRDDKHAPVLVLLNSADHPVLLDHLETTAPSGSRWTAAHSLAAAMQDLTVGAAPLHVVLPPRSAQVWVLDSKRVDAEAAPDLRNPSLSLGAAGEDGRLPVSGTAPANGNLQLVVDGNLQQAQTVQLGANGRYSALIDTRSMLDPDVQHRVVVYDAKRGHASPAQQFSVQPQWQLLAEVDDPAGDDSGRSGTYEYPLDASWREHRQADIRRIEVYGSGGALRVDVQMASLTRLWNPAQGFDHVALTLFLQFPGRSDGGREMPQQNAQLPSDMRWNLRLRAHGWSNALFTAAGASMQAEGTPLTPGALITTDPAARLIRFTLPASALGDRTDLDGLKLYVNSWDYDGGYRALAPQAGPHSFGGGSESDPRVMDESEVIVLDED